jgi:hypothetical protein
MRTTLDLTNNETFQNMFLLCAFIGIADYFVLWTIFKKRGIDVYATKNKIILLVSCLIPCLSLFWVLPDIPFHVKISITILGIATEFLSFYSLGKAGKRFRETLKSKVKKIELGKRK